MLVTFKTITQQTFQLELEPSTTMAEIKQKICDEKGEAVDSQKLIYNGKILQDEETLEQVKVDEKKFIVVMVSKKKPEAPAPTTSAPATEKAEPAKAAEETAAASKSSAAPSASTNQSSSSSSSLEVPAEYADMVDMIQGMGYPRDEVIRALKAAFYNPDRCVEYLCNGIPDNIPAELVSGDADQLEDEEEGAQGLNFLQNSPQFQQIRDLVRARPELLSQIIQQIAGNNPELMEAIRNNQEEFLQMINAEPTDLGAGATGGATGGGAAAGGGGQNPPGTVTIAVSESDRNAIQRLKALGFPEALVIEAFFACDKNEDLAANYILARMDEFHDQNSGL